MLSKEEIEKTKDRIKILLKDDCNCSECIKNKKAYETLLQYIQELETENNKQNKIIGEMAEFIISSAIVDDTVCSRIFCEVEGDCSHKKMLKCTKQYFEKKVDDKNVENKR